MIRLRREGTQGVSITFNMRSEAARERLFARISKQLDGDLISISISIPIQDVLDVPVEVA